MPPTKRTGVVRQSLKRGTENALISINQSRKLGADHDQRERHAAHLLFLSPHVQIRRAR